MHCPSCGQPATSEQQFCRNRGMSLETVGKLVAAHSSAPMSTSETKVSKAEAENAIVRRMFRLMGWGIVFLGLGIVMLVVNKSFIFGGWFGLVASFFMLLGAVLTTFSVFRGIREGIDVAGQTSPKSVSQGSEIKSVPTERTPVPMPSVTERTTQLIADIADDEKGPE